VCKAHRLLFHSTLGLRVMKKKKSHPPFHRCRQPLRAGSESSVQDFGLRVQCLGYGVWGVGLRVQGPLG